MKQLLFTSLMLVVGIGCSNVRPDMSAWRRALNFRHVHYQVMQDTSKIIYGPDDNQWVQRDEFIMMEIILINKPGVHFFKKGYKRGDKYWYFDGRRVKPLPKNWMVWEWREIKD